MNTRRMPKSGRFPAGNYVECWLGVDWQKAWPTRHFSTRVHRRQTCFPEWVAAAVYGVELRPDVAWVRHSALYPNRDNADLAARYLARYREGGELLALCEAMGGLAVVQHVRTQCSTPGFLTELERARGRETR